MTQLLCVTITPKSCILNHCSTLLCGIWFESPHSSSKSSAVKWRSQVSDITVTRFCTFLWTCCSHYWESNMRGWLCVRLWCCHRWWGKVYWISLFYWKLQVQIKEVIIALKTYWFSFCVNGFPNYVSRWVSSKHWQRSFFSSSSSICVTHDQHS